jgi:uncharacterized heparinase superfamily protein
MGKRIYHGEFCFAGQSVLCRGASIFEVRPPSKEWLESLHGFSWLADLEATGLELARVNARALVSDWLDRDSYHPKPARSLPLLCRRLIAWINAAPFLMQHAGDDFLGRFCSGLASHVRDLQLRSTFCFSPAMRLDCACALAYAAVALKGMETARAAALEQLAERLSQQILPDGGPVSRSPTDLVKLLLDALPLRRACEDARIDLPATLAACIERMLPMLRFFLHGDGGLASFHGATDPAAAQCRAVLAADISQGKPLSNARYSGFMRLSHGRTLVICDTGSPARGASPPPLAFEFSDGGSRIIINHDSEKTLEVEPLATVRQAPLPIHSLLGNWRRPAVRVEAAFSSTAVGSLLEARHDAYAPAGFIHERCLFLSATGTDFRGEDRFFPVSDIVGEAFFRIRFHLHPSVRAETAEDGACVLLNLLGKSVWTFKARGAEMSLADGTCSLGTASPSKADQIVLTGSVSPSPIHWAFKLRRF